MVHWTEHGAPLPTGHPPRLGGHGRRPALVQNVETLAHLALIMRHGASWFRSAGTPAEPGSMLVTLLGAVRHPGVYEIEPGMPVRDMLELAGGTTAEPGALLIGGYFGTWARAAAALPLRVLRGRAGRGRRYPRRRCRGRAAGRRLRAGRDRAPDPLPRQLVGRPVRPLRVRPRRDRPRTRAGRRRRQPRPAPGAALAAGRHRARRVPASRRHGAHGRQRAARLPRRDRPARARLVQRHQQRRRSSRSRSRRS